MVLETIFLKYFPEIQVTKTNIAMAVNSEMTFKDIEIVIEITVRKNQSLYAY